MCMACLQALSRLLHCFNEALYMLRGAKAPTGRSELTKINTSSRCPPVVCTSDGAEWQERTLYLALTWMEIAHEAALFWPEALPWMFWPMTLELKRPKQTAPPRVTGSLSAAADDGPIGRPFTAGTLCSSLPRWQLTDGSRSGTRLLAYETITRLNGTGDTQELEYL